MKVDVSRFYGGTRRGPGPSRGPEGVATRDPRHTGTDGDSDTKSSDFDWVATVVRR